MSLLPALFPGIDAQQFRSHLKSSRLERKNSAPQLPKAMSQSESEVVELLKPHLNNLAHLFETLAQNDSAYIAPQWQVDLIGEEGVSIQSGFGDRYDEALEISGNFSGVDEKLAVANAIALHLNQRVVQAQDRAVLILRLEKAEQELVELRLALAEARCSQPVNGDRSGPH